MGGTPGGSLVETLHPQCNGPRFDPWARTKISHVTTQSLYATAKTQCTPKLKTKSPKHCREFPGSPVVMTPCFHCRGHGFSPWLEN